MKKPLTNNHYKAVFCACVVIALWPACVMAEDKAEKTSSDSSAPISLEELAKKTQAVNTVINDRGKLIGHNTDGFGLRKALEEGIEESGIKIKTAVIYGNGGVSGVAFRVLEDLGFVVEMVGRNEEKVMKKKQELGIKDKSSAEGPYDLLVDATPISEDPDFLKNAKGFSELLEGCKMIFSHNMPEKDGKVNYLKKYCNDSEIYFISGKVMYIAQMIKQFGLYLEGLKNKSGAYVAEKDIIDAWGL